MKLKRSKKTAHENFAKSRIFREIEEIKENSSWKLCQKLNFSWNCRAGDFFPWKNSNFCVKTDGFFPRKCNRDRNSVKIDAKQIVNPKEKRLKNRFSPLVNPKIELRFREETAQNQLFSVKTRIFIHCELSRKLNFNWSQRKSYRGLKTISSRSEQNAAEKTSKEVSFHQRISWYLP